MQNLLWKSAVLLAVIGGSCYVVWQAHNGIQASSSQDDVEEFVAIDSSSADSENAEIPESDTNSPLGMQLEPLPGFAANETKPLDPEPEPTLAPPQEAPSHATTQDSPKSEVQPIRFASIEKEQTSEPETNPFVFTSATEEDTPKPTPAQPVLPEQDSEPQENPFAKQTYYPAGGSRNSTPEQPAQGQPPAQDLVIPIAGTKPNDSQSVLPENNPFLPLAVKTEAPKQPEAGNLFPTPEPLPKQPEPTVAAAPEPVPFGPSTSPLAPTEAPALMAPRPAGRSRIQTAEATSTDTDSGIRQVSGEFPAVGVFPEQDTTAPPAQAEPLLPFASEQPEANEPAEPLLPAFTPEPRRQPAPTPESSPAESGDNPFARFRSSIPSEPATIPSESPFAPSPIEQPESDESSGITTFTPAPSSTIPEKPSTIPREQPASTIPELTIPDAAPVQPSGFDQPAPLDQPTPADWGKNSTIPTSPEPLPPQGLLPLPPRETSVEPPREMRSTIPEPGPITPAFQESPTVEPTPENLFPRITPAGGESKPVESTIPRSTPPEALPQIYPAGEMPASSIPRSSIPSQPVPTPTPDPAPVPVNSTIPTRTNNTPSTIDTPSTISTPSTIPGGNRTIPTFELDRTDANHTETNRRDLTGGATSDPQVPSGPQAPKIKIEKIAPPEATIGEPLVYSIVIRNIGGSDAQNVVVEDRIPRGTRLDGTIPQAVLSGDKLIWELGKLPPNAEEKIQLKVVPIEAGEIGSVATVSFGASVSATIRVTAPDLSLNVQAPEEALVGESVTYDFIIKNSGQGDAKNVYLRAILPAGLKHPGGNDLEYEVGNIPAGESRNVRLNVMPTEIGIVTPQAMVTIDSKAHSDVKSDLRIIDSRLQVNRKGPNKRFVNRAGTYTNTVTNQSIEPLKNVVLTEAIPRGVEVVSSAHNGRWDASRRIITWSIPALQPGESLDLSCELKPSLPGAHQGKVIAQDGLGKQVELVTDLDVKGFADLHADVARDLTPVAVGEQVSMRMSVVNSGNASAKGVQTAFQIPRELDFVTAQGPVKHHYDPTNHTVTFAALDEVPADERKSYDYNIVLTAAQACEADVQVQLLSNEEEQQFKKRVTVLGNADTATPAPFGFTR